MDYKGLGSVIGRKQSAAPNRETLMRKAAEKKQKSGLAGNIVGGGSAALTAYLTGGNPTATMAAFSAGKGLTEGIMEGDSSKGISGAMEGAGGAMGYSSEMKAAQAASKKEELLAAALKKLNARV